jgi:hypothetical protein
MRNDAGKPATGLRHSSPLWTAVSLRVDLGSGSSDIGGRGIGADLSPAAGRRP